MSQFLKGRFKIKGGSYMKKKRLVAAVTIALFTLGLAGCGQKAEPPKPINQAVVAGKVLNAVKTAKA